MSKKTRVITLTAIFTALTLVSLYIASVWPTGLFGLVAVSSLFVAGAIIEKGIIPGLYVYICSSVLGMLIVPDKAAPLLFILFFGYYPVIKSLTERLKNNALQWILKLAVFNAALTVIWFFTGFLILSQRENLPPIVLIYVLGSIVFVLFDYGYTKVIWLYINRVSKFNKKG